MGPLAGLRVLCGSYAVAMRSQAVAGKGKAKPPPPLAGGFSPAKGCARSLLVGVWGARALFFGQSVGMTETDTMSLQVAPENGDLQLRLLVGDEVYVLAWDQAARLHSGLGEALAMALLAGALELNGGPFRAH